MRTEREEIIVDLSDSCLYPEIINWLLDSDFLSYLNESEKELIHQYSDFWKSDVDMWAKDSREAFKQYILQSNSLLALFEKYQITGLECDYALIV